MVCAPAARGHGPLPAPDRGRYEMHTMPEPPKNLTPARELIETRYAEPLGVAALARTVGLSRAHFSREFHRTFGASPHQYLVACRMERAAALLRAADRPIADVCHAVGLRSVGSFTTRFTRTFGISPAAYRTAHRHSATARAT
jgi:AraC-like DNA-binding protein